MFDCIIIGGGPAGMTAAMYLGRKKVKTLLITADFGGQMAKAATIENYPGIESISGVDLTAQMRAQVEGLGVEVKPATAEKIIKSDEKFVVTADGEEFQAKAVIVASGKTHRKLDVPGEKEFTGKGVGYCVTCDGPLFNGKSVAIIGGGNSALDGALELEKYAEKVYIINLNETFQGDEVRVDKVKKSAKIEIIAPAKTVELFGDKFLEKLKYQNLNTKEEKEITLAACFIEVGWVPATAIVRDLADLNDLKEVKVDENNKTKTEGLFVCGDVTETEYKQIIIAAGDAAKAALSAWKYVITHK